MDRANSDRETSVDGKHAAGRTRVAAASAVLGPALMSLGDLIHPPESWDPAAQIDLLAGGTGRWYAAHLLLFVGMLVFVPGVLGLTRLGADRKPVAAYVARVLMLISIGGMAAVFVFEMLLGSFLAQGADRATAVVLLEAFQAPQVFAALLPSLLAFFVGTGCFVWSLLPAPPDVRWPAVLFALGAALILAEIVLARVLLSQMGNVLMFLAGIGFARVLVGPSGRAPSAR